MHGEPAAKFSAIDALNGARAVIRVLRLHQWAKNLLVFVPLVLAGKSRDLETWLHAGIGFIAFGLTASGAYIINDICDRDHDRRHWSKSLRPIASGDIALVPAAGLAVISLGTGIGLSTTLGPAALNVLAAYAALTVVYSVWLKRQPIIDVVLIAMLFTLRLAFGTALANAPYSAWLMVLSMSTFLSLALAKRLAELLRGLEMQSDVFGRGYRPADLHFVRGIGLASATTAVLTLILYMIEEAFPHHVYGHPRLLWAAPLLLFLFFARIWLTAERGELDDDPVKFALKDPACILYGVTLAGMFALALR